MSVGDLLRGSDQWQVAHGSALELLRELPDGCADSIVTDPAYGLGTREPTPDEIVAYLTGVSELNIGSDFMGKDWKVPSVAIWKECLRVLKPGGFMTSFTGSRTTDLIGLGIRMAGFWFCDTLEWHYGSGMPHALNVSKAIDGKNGVKHLREVIHKYKAGGNAGTSTKDKGGTYGVRAPNSAAIELTVTRGASDTSRAWDDYFTNLKPAHEPIVLAQKPYKGRVVDNVLLHGVGALNIGGCRVARDWSNRSEAWRKSGHSAKPEAEKIAAPPGNGIVCHPEGSYPPNLLLQHSPGCQVVGTKIVAGDERGQCDGKRAPGFGDVGAASDDPRPCGRVYGASEQPMLECEGDCPIRLLEEQAPGSAIYFPQFFYSSKASTRERDLGLPDGLKNRHSTVKKLAVVRWLSRLVTPRPGCLIVDPFCGSGTHGMAAIAEGFRYYGIEKSNTRKEPWVALARKRIAHIEKEMRAA